MEKEVRSLGEGIEVRANDSGEPQFIEGYAIVFNQRSQDLGGFIEVVTPDAIRGADMSDVVALFNHDSNYILGRSSAGTLSLTTDSRGVKYRIKYDPTDDDHRRVVNKIAKGELKGSSFRFAIAEGGDSWERQTSGTYLRTINAFKGIYDVGPVTYPAYVQTTTAQRALQQYQRKNTKHFIRKERLKLKKKLI